MPKKKGGGGGGGESKKTVQKKKQQLLEDKTFGLKNKNKSKKVQNHIKSVEKTVMNSGDRKQRLLEEQRKKAKADAKARKKAAKEEQDALFGEALLAVQKKKTTNMAGGKVEAKGRDADEEDNKKTTSRAMKMMYQMDAQEMSDKLREDPNYVPTLEDEIEAQRQQKVEELKRLGKGTPVTPETFAAWQERKRKKKAAEVKQKVEAEFKKKKGGKGLAVLTGRDLYEYKKDVFDKVDDDDDGNDNGNNDGDFGDGNKKPASDPSQGDKNDENAANGTSSTTAAVNGVDAAVHQVAAKVDSELFLQGDDDDLDDIVDDD